MSRWLNVAVVMLLVVASALAATSEIAPDRILEHIKFLASDEMRGRADGSPELERAAEYIAKEFDGIGLRPGGKNDTWFQPFELIAGLVVGPRNMLVLRDGGRVVRFRLGVSYFPLSATSNESLNADALSADLKDLPVVFAGYGISAPRLDYDDYAGLDVNDKAVLIFSHEPQEANANSRLNGRQPLPETTLYAKARAARSHGARALVVVTDPSHQAEQADFRIFAIDPDAEDLGIPVLRVRRDDAAPLIEMWGLNDLARRIDDDLMPRSRRLPNTVLTYTESLTKNRRTVRNVIGVLPGDDPARSAEAIVVGAHYDHIGLGGRLSVQSERTGEIHNGADDNASGTSALIEIARAAAAERARFHRSLVFIAFAGEERGLLGSAQYAREPTIPLATTLAMLNLDMVGRAKGAVSVSGLELAPSLNAEVDAAATKVGGLMIRHEGPGAGRSDDSSFIERRVPALNFFTGFHEDYHSPTDDWQRIDAEGTARIARLALELAARIAGRSDKPEFVSR